MFEIFRNDRDNVHSGLSISGRKETIVTEIPHRDCSTSCSEQGPHRPILLHLHRRGDATQNSRGIQASAGRIRDVGTVVEGKGTGATGNVDRIREQPRSDPRDTSRDFPAEEYR